MTIRSSPPGAVVYVDDYEIGATPASTHFTHYGKRKIRLVKDGYETLTVLEPVPAPWYEIPPLDFVADNLVPGEIRDHRTLHYQLTPQMVVPPDELRRRAEDLRSRVGLAGMLRSSPGGESFSPSPAPQGIFAPPPTVPETVMPPTTPPAGPVPSGPQPAERTPTHTLPPGGWPVR